jgi:hypothetical protein
LLSRLEHEGFGTTTFAYSATFENVAAIRMRLIARITALAEQGDYVLIGHSLGGVLLRCAVSELPEGTRLPRRLFLLGSPVHAPRLAQRFRDNVIYRAVTRDCGQLLGSPERMLAIGAITVPTISIAGTRGLPASRRVFESNSNDGVLAVSEVTAEWITEHHQVDTIHTLLPFSIEVAQIIAQRMGAP